MAGKPRKSLLCVTFLTAARAEIPKTLLRNMKIMGSSCQWAIVMYDGNEAEVKAVCSHVEVAPQTVLCLRSVDSISLEKKSTPKTVLYQSLLLELPDFEKVHTPTPSYPHTPTPPHPHPHTPTHPHTLTLILTPTPCSRSF
jgi:hypothetical protein